MRISQIKTLCWASNVVVLLGAGWVGVRFFETYEARGARAEVAWPQEPDAPAIETRWPGEITAFRPIWNTPVDGLVPKPPEPAKPAETRRDLKADFLAKHTFTTAMLVVGDEADSVAYLKVPGSQDERTLRTGETLSGFTLIGFERSPETRVPVLVFTHPEIRELVRMERMAQPIPEVFHADPPPFQAVAANDLVQPPVSRNSISRQAYQDLLGDPSGLTWVVPPDELAWWREFGESEVLSKLVVNAVTAPDGTPRGIRIMSPIGAGTPVGTGRGINQGDTIVSINGVPVRGKEDILRFLRGSGAGLTRYEVVVESEGGSERTLVYRVDRRSPRRTVGAQR